MAPGLRPGAVEVLGVVGAPVFVIVAGGGRTRGERGGRNGRGGGGGRGGRGEGRNTDRDDGGGRGQTEEVADRATHGGSP
ncbi:hypothetical protein DKM19_46195 [Streptosporangium sp. 'caverna']|nr:hypothetical protein DKM19_46195 [Streptosporangium sp. 'caverna']